MQKERGEEEEINRHLRLEIETLRSPQRIEALATAVSTSSRRRPERPSSSSASSHRIPRRRRSSPTCRRSRVSEPTSDSWRATIRSRLLFGAVDLRAVGRRRSRRASCISRCTSTTTFRSRAANQSARTMDISAKRGDILDRHGRVLAYSVDSDSVYGVPSEIEDAGDAASLMCARAWRLRGERAGRACGAAAAEARVRLCSAPRHAAAGAAYRRARARRHRLHQGRPALLSEEAARRAAARIRRRRQQGAGRHRSGLRQPDQRLARQAALPDRRARSRVQPARASADRGRDASSSRSTSTCSTSPSASCARPWRATERPAAP